VLFEGHISSENPPQYRNLVAYVVERQFRNSSFNPQRYARPALLVDLADGSLTITGTYRMLRPPVTQSYQPDVPDENTNYRVRGFVVGSPALVFGTTQTAAAGSVAVEARLVYGGTRAEFIAEQQRARWLGDQLGLALAGGGIVLFCLLFFGALVAGVSGALAGMVGRRR
jgi:hypothetical protein